MNDVRLKFTLI